MSDDTFLAEDALRRIDTLIAAVDRAEAAGLDYVDTVRIRFLRNFTVEPIEPYVKFHVMRAAIQPTITFGDYDTAMQEALDAQSELRREPPEIIVLALELALLDPEYGAWGWSADAAIERLDALFDALRDNTSSLIVINTVMAPFQSVEGIATAEHRTVNEVARINSCIWDYAAANVGRFVVADWERLLRNTGRAGAIDDRFWRTSLAPLKAEFLDLYAREIAKVVRALKGRAKKCLILDCDDTLWGGVIGEEGLETIRLAATDWPGQAYYEFQRSVLALHSRGILVAICSKNNADDVWEVMQGHPHCLLQPGHLAAWRINWDDKATNIALLSDELKLPLDSFVFVDDSPRECQLVRDALPQVTVLQVPASLYEYPDLLLRDGLFDTLTLSSEDARRGDLYREAAERTRDRNLHIDLDDYLASLDQTLQIWEATDKDRPRIAQLTQKTNQFNLTTHRYAEGQIEAFELDDAAAVLAIAVRDRYGDLGTTGVLIARREGGSGVVDTLLLSCRILGRKLELAFVDKSLRLLEKRWGISDWRAEYRPTKKNAQVADFWDRVGFSVQAETDNIKSYSMAAGRRVGGYEKVMSIIEAGSNAGTD